MDAAYGLTTTASCKTALIHGKKLYGMGGTRHACHRCDCAHKRAHGDVYTHCTKLYKSMKGNRRRWVASTEQVNMVVARTAS